MLVMEIYPYHIFISYATKDITLVNKLEELLAGFCPGARLFVAEYSVPFGDDIALAAYTELFRADTVVLLWSENSQASEWVKTELAYSHLFSKHIIQVKLSQKVQTLETIQAFKYISAYRFDNIYDCFIQLAQQIAKRSKRFGLCRRLLLQALRTRHSFTTDDDAYYDFAMKELKKPSDSRYLFLTRSPTLVLPEERYTPTRQEYAEVLRYRFLEHPGAAHATYVFDKQKTYGRLLTNAREARSFLRTKEWIERYLHESGLEVSASPNLDFVPSGMLVGNKAAIVLKDPLDPHRTVGVYFLKGKDAEFLGKQLRPIIHREMVISAHEWYPELLNLLEFRERMKPEPTTKP